MTTIPERDLYEHLNSVGSGLNYFDLHGEPIGLGDWVRINDRLHHLAEDYVPSMRGTIRVSTIYLGTDHRFWNPDKLPPVIFETMIQDDDGEWLDQFRYCDMATALDAHRKIADAFAQSWWLNLGGRG